MSPITYDVLVELSLNILFYFTIGSIGAFLKVLYDTLNGRSKEIKLSPILVASISSTFICLGLQDIWLSKMKINTVVFVAFVMGVLGFELFGNITTLSKLQKVVIYMSKFKKGTLKFMDYMIEQQNIKQKNKESQNKPPNTNTESGVEDNDLESSKKSNDDDD